MSQNLKEFINEKATDKAVKEHDKLLDKTFDSILELSVKHRQFIEDYLNIDRSDDDYSKLIDPIVDGVSAFETNSYTMRKKTVGDGKSRKKVERN